MATISKYATAAGDRYRVRYRKPNGRQTDKRGFVRKKDAEAFAATVEMSKLKGEYVAPSLGRETIGNLGPQWLQLKKGSIKPSSYDKLDGAWRNYVAPHWAEVPVSKVRKSDVQIWVNEITKSATVVRRAAGVLAGILDLAVDDQLIPKHPAREVKLPRKTKGMHGYLTVAQLNELIAEIPEYHRPFVRLLASTGIRYGEATALQGKHINRRTGRITIERTMSYRQAEAGQNGKRGKGEYIVGPVKTYETRTIPVPAHVLADMPLVMPEALAYPTPAGEMRPYLSETSYFAGAVKRLQAGRETWNLEHPTEDPQHFPTVTPHDLRHTFVSIAISQGANVKAIQKMLGHASAAMTLDQYADLFDEDLDAVAKAIGELVA